MELRIKDAVFPIIAVNVIVFVLQTLLGEWFSEAFMLVSADVLSRPWILLTSMFLHGNTTHIIFNMYALFMFGPLIEQRIGIKRFVYIYFASGILAAVVSTFFYPKAFGASGAIMGILGATIMLLPDLPVLFFFVIPMSLRTAGIIFALVDIFGIFVPSGIANIAHLVGLACGLGYGYYLIRQKKKFNQRFVEMPKKISSVKKEKKGIEMSKEDVDDFIRNGRL